MKPGVPMPVRRGGAPVQQHPGRNAMGQERGLRDGPGHSPFIIVGAGQAGARAAEALRAAGHQGGITLIGEEAHAPYERPQLSKETLLSPDGAVKLIRQAADWQALGVDLVTGTRIVSGDAADRVLQADDGRVFPYARLLLATGTRPRRLPAIDAGPVPVLTLRTIGDAMALRGHLRPGLRLVIIGGGVIGLEAAAAATAKGADVTLVEAAPGLLARAFPTLVADHLRRRHEAAGVSFHLGQAPVGMAGDAVRLADGTDLPADLVLVGIGVEPVPEPARALGVAGEDGVRVDAYGRTSVPGIFAAGDGTSHWCPWAGRFTRVETWANAQNQAVAAAWTMAGQPRAYEDPPWFWTNQYEQNIQVVGNPLRGVANVRGDVGSGRFSVISTLDGTVTGAVTVNMPKDMGSLRRLVAARARVAAADLENPGFDLRRALAAA